MNSTGEKVNGLEFMTIESIQSKAKRLKKKKKEQSLGDYWDNIKHSNIHVIRAPGVEEREIKKEKIFEEIMAGVRC